MIKVTLFDDTNVDGITVEMTVSSALIELFEKTIRSKIQSCRLMIGIGESQGILRTFVSPQGEGVIFSARNQEMEPLFRAVYAYLLMHGVKWKFDYEPGGIRYDEETAEFILPQISAPAIIQTALLVGMGLELDRASELLYMGCTLAHVKKALALHDKNPGTPFWRHLEAVGLPVGSP